MAEHYFIDIEGFVEEGGKLVPTVMKVSYPKCAEETDDWYCEILAPALFDQTKKIYGIDEPQAQTLSTEFLKSLLQDRPLFNESGQLITPLVSD